MDITQKMKSSDDYTLFMHVCIQDQYCYVNIKDRNSSVHSQLEDVELMPDPAYEEVPQPSPPAAEVESEYEECGGSTTSNDGVVQTEQSSLHSQFEDVELEPNPAYHGNVLQSMHSAEPQYAECGGTTANDAGARNEQSGVHSQFEDVQLEPNPAYGVVLPSTTSPEPQYAECGGSATDNDLAEEEYPTYQSVDMQTAAQMEEVD